MNKNIVKVNEVVVNTQAINYDCPDGIYEYNIKHVTYMLPNTLNEVTGIRCGSEGGLMVKGRIKLNKETSITFIYCCYNAKIAASNITAIMNKVDINQQFKFKEFLNKVKAYNAGLEDVKPGFPTWDKNVNADCDYTQKVQVKHYNGYVQLNFNEYQFNK